MLPSALGTLDPSQWGGNMTAQRTNSDEWRIDRRTVLRGVVAAGAGTVVGLPVLSRDVVAQGIEVCGELDVYCAIDTSGSLSSTERTNLEAAINGFVDALPTDGAVQVGTLEFGNDGLRNKNDLQNPGGLTVSVSTTRGNTPMSAAVDVADQALYGDASARAGADKLLVVFTDGGPNYSNSQFGVGGYTAPRDDSTDWSLVSGDSPPAYDGAGTAATGNDGRQVTELEMDETKLVAGSVRSNSVGDGATSVATVYVGEPGEEGQAMGTDALATYTDLPTYLSTHVASSSEFAITGDLADVESLVDQLLAVLAEACCVECTTDGALVKYEWDDDLRAFVVEGPGDDHVELTGVTLDDGEPVEACFDVEYCAVDVVVKAGTAYEVTENESGDVCVAGIDATGPNGQELTRAISNVRVYCEAPADLTVGSSGRNRRGGRDRRGIRQR